MTMSLTVLKLGGELIDDAAKMRGVALAIARASATGPLVVVHGGGREIDAAMAAAGIAKQQVDGVRVTDAATLGVVVPVLAGAINTRFVAAIGAAGARPVGLTGADASVSPVTPHPPLQAVDGRTVSLGFVGNPVTEGRADLLTCLTFAGYVPVIASIGADTEGTLYNVNADTMAAAVAVRSGAARLVIAGATAGVLDADGRTVERIDESTERAMVAAKTINAGMVAKLKAARAALAGGVATVHIVDGRNGDGLLAALVEPAAARTSATAVVS
jgi:acetylglutamate kinase